jgi:hypothetical protein
LSCWLGIEGGRWSRLTANGSPGGHPSAIRPSESRLLDPSAHAYRPEESQVPQPSADAPQRARHRVAALGCRVALVRPMDAMGNYPLQPKYEPVMGRARRDRDGLWHAPIPGLRQFEALWLQRTVFRRRIDPPHRRDIGPAALLPDQCAELLPHDSRSLPARP